MTVRLQDIGKEVRDTQYAVRGEIVVRAAELERQGREIIYCNIGNPQALGQKPITWIRQALALSEYPELIDQCGSFFPADVVATARLIVKESQHGLGAYTDSKGMRFVRTEVARFIHERDGVTTDPEHIYLTDGASKGVQTILRILIADKNDGIMIPIPQYPLYSATITLYGGVQVHYHLEEKSGWRLSLEQLENAYRAAQSKGIRVRGLCVINPGNPTGAVLDEENIAMVIAFAREKGLALLADEVYQENVYLKGDHFCSFAKLLERSGEKDVSLFVFQRVSWGMRPSGRLFRMSQRSCRRSSGNH